MDPATIALSWPGRPIETTRSHRCPDHLDGYAGEHLVEASGELRVAVPDEELKRPTLLSEIACEVAGNLGDEGAGRMIGDPEDVDYATLELDDEQYIELGELDGVHDEEVGGQDAARLGDEELLPRRPAPRCWSETVVSKYSADRACRETGPETAKLALNANTSPASVLPAESDDELDDLIAERGMSRTSLGSPTFPLASRELPMPAEQGIGRDEKATPPPSRERPAERREDRSIRGPITNAAMELTLQHPDLVAEHHQLDVLFQRCPPAGSQQAEDPAHDEIAEAEGHGR
ncbi:MAG: hypothetical protein ABR972_15690 [Acidimicrobiales bacterium]